MHITTHLLMADTLYKAITSQMTIELDYISYVYGNIKPDVHPGTIDWPHFSKDSLDDLLAYCEQVITTPMSLKAFSLALGVISHFICDYYCLYHTETYRKKGIIKHTIYEHFLELTFIKRRLTRRLSVVYEKDDNEIEDTIRTHLEHYQNEKHSIDKDIKYAINIAASVVTKLIVLSEIQNTQIPDMEIVYDLLKVKTV